MHLAFLLTFSLAFYLAHLLTLFLAFYLVYLLTFFVVEVRQENCWEQLDPELPGWSGGEHCDLELRVEIQRGTLLS